MASVLFLVMESVVFSFPLLKWLKWLLDLLSSHSFVITALCGERRDFPLSGSVCMVRANMQELKLLSQHPMEGEQRCQGLHVSGAGVGCCPQLCPSLYSLGKLVKVYIWCFTLAKLGATSCGKLPAADPTARWDLSFMIIPHRAAFAAGETAFFSLATMPLGSAGLIKFESLVLHCSFKFSLIWTCVIGAIPSSFSLFLFSAFCPSFLSYVAVICLFLSKATFLLQCNGLKQHPRDF